MKIKNAHLPESPDPNCLAVGATLIVTIVALDVLMILSVSGAWHAGAQATHGYVALMLPGGVFGGLFGISMSLALILDSQKKYLDKEVQEGEIDHLSDTEYEKTYDLAIDGSYTKTLLALFEKKPLLFKEALKCDRARKVLHHVSDKLDSKLFTCGHVTSKWEYACYLEHLLDEQKPEEYLVSLAVRPFPDSSYLEKMVTNDLFEVDHLERFLTIASPEDAKELVKLARDNKKMALAVELCLRQPSAFNVLSEQDKSLQRLGEMALGRIPVDESWMKKQSVATLRSLIDHYTLDKTIQSIMLTACKLKPLLLKEKVDEFSLREKLLEMGWIDPTPEHLKHVSPIFLGKWLNHLLIQQEKSLIQTIIACRPDALDLGVIGARQTLREQLATLGWRRFPQLSSETKRYHTLPANKDPKPVEKGLEIEHPKLYSDRDIETYRLALAQSKALSEKGDLVFAHSQAGSLALLNDFLTQTEVSDIARVTHPKLARERIVFRTPGNARYYPDTETFVKAAGAEHTGFDNYDYTDILLSCTPNLRDTTANKSALGVFREAGSVGYTQSSLVTDEVAHLYSEKTFYQQLAKDLESLGMRHPGKRLYVIGMSEETAKEIAYPAHGMGYRCKKHADHKNMIQQIREANDLSQIDPAHACCGDDNLQYRILAPEMDKREDVKIYAFDNMSNQADYKKDMQAIGRWGRCFKRLERMIKIGTQEAVLEALRRIPLYEDETQIVKLYAYKRIVTNYLVKHKSFLSKCQPYLRANKTELPPSVQTLLTDIKIL